MVLDFVGTDATMSSRPASRALTARSRWSAWPAAALPFRSGALPFDCAITVPYWGSAVELMEVLALAREGKIRSRIRRFPLSQAPDAYAQLREGKIDGRAVITPQEP